MNILSPEQIKKKYGLWRQEDINYEYQKQFRKPEPKKWKLGDTRADYIKSFGNLKNITIKYSR